MKIRQELPDDDVDLTTFYNPMFQKSNILPLGAEQLPEYADVIRRSFATIAKDFNWTKENCPSHTSFVTNERLGCKIKNGYYPFALNIDNKIIGFVSLSNMGSGAFEMNDVSIFPEYRHFGYGKKMIDFCKAKIRELGGSKITIGIVEKNAVLKDWYVANGFVHTGTKNFDHLPFPVGFMEWSTALYVSTIPNPILTQNKASWDAVADDWFGVTALPTYGCLCPTEDELHLFGDITGKKILDIGCGSGHSLKWCGDRSAGELWGLDNSTKQIENAVKYLRESGYMPKLYSSPMEQNPGLPDSYFDIIYSIYAIGWTVDLQTTFSLVSSYLKPGGIFIFSWDHPFMHCVEVEGEKLIFSGNYFEREPFTFKQGGNPVTLYNHRLSDYINALAVAGFSVEQLLRKQTKKQWSGIANFQANITHRARLCSFRCR